MTKPIYEILIENLHRIKETGFLRTVLREYNLHNHFNYVYETNEKKEDATFIIVFLILAYSNRCSWIMNANMNKDRITVKLEIINSILIDSKLDVSEEVKSLVAQNNIDGYEELIYTYLNWQKSRDFVTLMTLMEYSATCKRHALGMKNVDKYSDLKSMTDTLNGLEDIERQITEVQNRIERDFASLDEALKKEGRVAISKNIDIVDYESRVLNRPN